ncbi:SGNH/GDSL hydrolase family protein [Actinomadura parmotrematis]|uniref:SGNH/GDSL hydrolase family protein n=1 Tax=Actinomadura parmotrematis TaxID=2864039 RepID=A0ABS7G2A7_9ACTN|nr:SGNH/GDSL hydrolase family protein [Actinomadura parmotrematis]MBW8486843.1 SGNH/GDSL hydrolase family protein [Actinomadura parmotrematis]
MRSLRSAAALALAGLLSLAGVLAGPAPAGAASPEYVALGDSYSSGTGTSPYIDLLCTRSSAAYPVLYAAAHPGTSLKFVACGGATIPDVVSDQLSALSANTTLVTLSIGGNDSGFASTMLSCQYGTTATCTSALDKGRDFFENQLPGQLDSLYAQVRARAPQAKVVIVGYPRLFKSGGLCLGGLSAAKRALLNQAADDMSEVIAGRAAAAGFAFADARTTFAGHEICTTSPWIDSATVHPNATGHRQGYLPVVTAAAGA